MLAVGICESGWGKVIAFSPYQLQEVIEVEEPSAKGPVAADYYETRAVLPLPDN